jgi:hypothetical protein
MPHIKHKHSIRRANNHGMVSSGIPNEPFIRFNPVVIVLLAFISFGFSFLLYMLNVNINPSSFYEDNYGIIPQAKTEPPKNTENSHAPTYAVLNPVPRSPERTADYFKSVCFIGSETLQELADDITCGKIYYSDINSQVKNENIGSIKEKGSTKIYFMPSIDEDRDNHAETVTKVKDFLKSLRTSLEEYYKDIDAVDVQIFVMPVPPVTVEQSRTGNVKNTDIDSFNSMLLRMANEESFYYADVSTGLKGNNGTLPPSYLTESGRYKNSTKDVFREYILTHTIQSEQLESGD